MHSVFTKYLNINNHRFDCNNVAFLDTDIKYYARLNSILDLQMLKMTALSTFMTQFLSNLFNLLMFISFFWLVRSGPHEMPFCICGATKKVRLQRVWK